MMELENKLTVPVELANPFFFTNKFNFISYPVPSFNLKDFFLYEVHFYHGIPSYRPWDHPEETVPLILEEWGSLKGIIEASHKKRAQEETLPSMRKGIGLFLQLLFWCNRKPSVLTNPIPIADLSYRPVNAVERLNFIMSRPSLFHSFIQLGELMAEQEKQYALSIIKKKRPSSK